MESCLETKQGPTHKCPPLNAYLLGSFCLNAVMIQLLSNNWIFLKYENQ